VKSQQTLKVKEHIDKHKWELTIFSIQRRIETFLVKSAIACAITKYNIIVWESFTQFAVCTEYLDAEKTMKINIQVLNW
jgi:hypothetical protein